MNVNTVIAMNYDQMDTWSIRKNEPKTNPNEPKTNPIKSNLKIPQPRQQPMPTLVIRALNWQFSPARLRIFLKMLHQFTAHFQTNGFIFLIIKNVVLLLRVLVQIVQFTRDTAYMTEAVLDARLIHAQNQLVIPLSPHVGRRFRRAGIRSCYRLAGFISTK